MIFKLIVLFENENVINYKQKQFGRSDVDYSQAVKTIEQQESGSPAAAISICHSLWTVDCSLLSLSGAVLDSLLSSMMS